MINAAVLCLVVAISDGDTLKARCGERGTYQQVTLRLAEIDAPEKGQAFGQRSRQSLSVLCFGSVALIWPEKRDRYGRTIARVECRGTDASLHQVRTGMAWAFIRYLRDQSIMQAEDQAKMDQRGLWRDASPVPPWVYRAEKRTKAPKIVRALTIRAGNPHIS